MKRPLLCMGLIGALCACSSSPPTRYYTLAQIAPASAVASTASALVVRVQPITIPAELDRLELLSHTGANRVHISEAELWAAPLDEQIRRVFSADLALRLPPLMVADPSEPTSNDMRRLLSLAFDEFAADESCAITLHANWTLRGTNNAVPSQRGSESIQLPGSAPCTDVAGAMSRALAQLADRLAAIIAAAT